MTGRTRRSASLVANLGVSLGAVVLALVLAEGIARLAGLQPHVRVVELQPEIPTREFEGVPLWSERDPRVTPEELQAASNDRESFTVVGLGDSIMCGIRLPEEATYLEVARRTLAAENVPIRVINLATGGFNTRQEEAVYAEAASSLHPDVVLIHFWGDDFRQYKVVAGYLVETADLTDDGRLVDRALPLPAAVTDWLLLHSRVFDLVNQWAMQVRAARRPPNPWPVIRDPLARIVERARSQGARPILLASPVLEGERPRPAPELSQLREVASGLGVELLDLHAWVAEVPTKDIAMDTCHFNEAGHRIIGEKLAAYLLANDILEWRRNDANGGHEVRR